MPDTFCLLFKWWSKSQPFCYQSAYNHLKNVLVCYSDPQYNLLLMQELYFRYTAKVGFWMKRYENFVGLTEVKAAQHRVVEVTHPVWHSNCKF